MTKTVRFVSIDPSLRNVGMVCGTIEDEKISSFGEYKLITTHKGQSGNKKATQDLIHRCSFLQDSLKKTFSLESGCFFMPDVVFVELPSGSQSYSGSLSYAITCSLIASIKYPKILVTQKQVKERSVGDPKAGKKEMVEWAHNKYPEFNFPMYNGNINMSKSEHIADAIAIAVAGIQEEEFQKVKSKINESD